MIGHICTKPVVTLSRDTTVAEGARLMRAKNVGAVVIVNGTKPIGLVTDRDIAVDVVGQGKDPATTLMGSVMRKSLTVIRDNAGILDAARLFGKTGVRRLPVVNKAGTLVGIIALDDLLMLLGNEMGHMASGLTRSLKRAAA
ncbi:MAG TPA: CBS domain-containing protein [Candidatus Methylomirabilis sp.]|nr:CBS domain-containing protein [Candidatus Methylomirabilis sp.]